MDGLSPLKQFPTSHPTYPTPYRGSGNRGKSPAFPKTPKMGIVGKRKPITFGERGRP